MLLPPLTVCLERVRTRQRHGFTDRDAAEHMWHEFERAEIDRRHVLAEQDGEPEEIAQMLADRVMKATIRYP